MRVLWLIMSVLSVFLIIACNKAGNYDNPGLCDNEWSPNISMAELQSLYQGETTGIQEDWVIEAYVISSDQQGNFFGSIHIQDHPSNPSVGFEVLLDLPDTHLFFPPSRRVLINLKGLYMGKSRGNFQLGGVNSFFDQYKVGRLPGNIIENHIQLTCLEPVTIVPKAISLEKLEDENAGIYIEIDSGQFPEELLGQTYAEPKEETSRQLQDCQGNYIEMLNSGYADFASKLLPSGSGKIMGVLTKDGDDLRIQISKLSELVFTNERCPSGPDPMSSNNLLISEIADPDNNNEARFLELYNAGDEELPLLGWKLERYTNDNLNVGTEIDLSELSIIAEGTIIIASNALVFEEVFGFPPNLEGGKSRAADSNGDDNLVLRDPFGIVKDIFGRIGEDGSNTDHEFEDGKAQRISGISQGNPIYNPSEWILYNDTGLEGTLNLPQLAPEDFSPGVHNR
ncbi:MAG: lamin tail domain-containing protein [Eudoraea sp.]|nr:lamin tail domain-containing protein [Eudoraea sp.]